ncbi:acylaldehyde oxidase [Massilia sp. WF1]|uniref:xanthine dehydrogenase family protein molybdopterin-binding subunit n=1 Tax=unclassified Massilia TaxID=2609279 RepID=UPI00064B211D|nr:MULTISPECIES: xanthine dehydrogenase family protein molybdopterin-binding subunit [unclassified Massilia]ALK99491.1 acylaldehyde oxidase [Massilia sp. WG5]KLU38301.1 acylaldehyde oxidase [Massilia sp. WF1]
MVGWGLMPPRQRLRTASPLAVEAGAVALNGWVAIAADGTVSVVVPRSEMGQGVNTALPMLLAEELDAPLASVRISQAPIDKIFGNLTVLRENLPFHPDDRGSLKQGVQWVMSKVGRELGLMFTGGSTSVKDAWMPMREAGAVARAMLLRAAAEQWKIEAARLATRDGFVLHPDGRRLGYGELAARAASVGADIEPGDVRLKTPAEFRLIGQPVPRRDSPAKVNGTALFGIDARVPGMLYAAVRMAPVVGAGVASFDAAKALAMPGVVKVVEVSSALPRFSGAGAGVAVVAKTWWQAKQAAGALSVTWSASPHAGLSSEAIFADFAKLLDSESGFTYFESGSQDVQGARTLQAEYRAPFLAHATMEPINCTAQLKDGKLKLWTSTQVPSVAVEVAARVAGVDRADVALDVMLLGGGFGRRLETDMVAQAVAIARAVPGQAVQLVWTREDDIGHDVYRPQALERFAAKLDAQGNVIAWDNKSVSGAIGHQYFPRNLGLPGIGPDKTTAEGEYDMQYAIPNRRIAHVIADSAVSIGYWRSVGHSHNAFFKEGFLDEVAHAAGKDPVLLRRELLRGHPRHLAVLDAALAKAGSAPEGRAHGVAVHQSFGSIVAQVAEVSVLDKQIRVHRVVCAVDCGIVVNPNILAQQVESAVVFGLSAALAGEITLKDGQVQQTNFGDYPVLRMNEAPLVETVIVPSIEPPEGMGEPATPPVAPAVASAVFKLTGQRLRSLPLRLA